MNNILVSVVIPTFGRVELLKRALGSVIRQTYSNLEIIVIIDGKDDSTIDYISDQKDDRIIYIINDISLGGAESRNIGVRASKGEWIAFLDDDDEWLPEKIESQVRIASVLSSSDKNYIIGNQIIAEKDGKREIWATEIPDTDKPIWSYILERKGLYLNQRQVQTSSLMLQRKTLLEFPFVKIKRHQEWDLLLRISIFSESKFYMVKKPLSIWHIDENRKRISTHLQKEDYNFSIDWINSYRKYISKKAYGDFMLTVVSDIAKHGKNNLGQIRILSYVLRRGSPSIYALFAWINIVIFPRKTRHLIKRKLVVQRNKI